MGILAIPRPSYPTIWRVILFENTFILDSSKIFFISSVRNIVFVSQKEAKQGIRVNLSKICNEPNQNIKRF
jgi:hypothetical protein